MPASHTSSPLPPTSVFQDEETEAAQCRGANKRLHGDLNPDVPIPASMLFATTIWLTTGRHSLAPFFFFFPLLWALYQKDQPDYSMSPPGPAESHLFVLLPPTSLKLLLPSFFLPASLTLDRVALSNVEFIL